ncbi:unnamed protein product [Mucor hiemalis]
MTVSESFNIIITKKLLFIFLFLSTQRGWSGSNETDDNTIAIATKENMNELCKPEITKKTGVEIVKSLSPCKEIFFWGNTKTLFGRKHIHLLKNLY